MIAIQRSQPSPTILTTDGTVATEANHARYLANPVSYGNGDITFEFENRIYGAAEVKELLISMQAEKCCFCESKIKHISYGDVEHFRPKKGWKQNPDDNITRPGYYWLAYEWDNLLLSCQVCNQRHKGNLFPLGTPQNRALSMDDNYNEEDPLFINPTGNLNPETILGFRGDTPYSIGSDIRAECTIENLGLKRKALRYARLEKLEPLKWTYKIARGIIPASQEDVIAAEALLAKYASADEQYSSCVKCAINDGFAYV